MFAFCDNVTVCISSSDSQACSFPEEWRGKWFENGLGDVDIRVHSISHIGYCKSYGGHNKYLLLNRSGQFFYLLFPLSTFFQFIPFLYLTKVLQIVSVIFHILASFLKITYIFCFNTLVKSLYFISFSFC